LKSSEEKNRMNVEVIQTPRLRQALARAMGDMQSPLTPDEHDGLIMSIAESERVLAARGESRRKLYRP
jgi:hypothetical protein